MKSKIYTFQLILNWTLLNKLSELDKFGGSWPTVEKREKHSLKELKSVATVKSVGASTRIEGARISDHEVAVLIKNIDVTNLEERDQQEVAGYYEVLDLLIDSYPEIDITESNIKHLHNILMKYSEKDSWHKGNYKLHSNIVELTHRDGKKDVVFKTADPGFETEDAMRNLINWYETDKESHPLIRISLFVYDFLSIHPFQDGNGRLSRLLATLLLLKNDYFWVQYISFEHEIENTKSEYYNVLMHAQKNRPGEDVSSWVEYFIKCLNIIKIQLADTLDSSGFVADLSVKEKRIYTFIENNPGTQSGEISEKLDLPLPTVKRILSDLFQRTLINKNGVGRGTNYIVE